MTTGFGAGWRQVFACMVLLATTAMIASAYSVIAVPLAEAFHPSRMVLMLSMTIMALVSGLLSPMLGTLMDRTAMRPLMGLGAGLLVAGFVALSFATSFIQVLVIYGVLIAPANVLIGPMATTVLLSRWFNRRRGTAIGVAIAGIALGGFVFPPVIQGLLNGNDWRVALRLLALILLAVTTPAVAFIVDRPSDRGLHPDGAASEPELSDRERAAPALSAREILRDPTFWLAAAIFAVVLSGVKGTLTNLVPLAVDEGIRPAAAAYLISIYAACGFAAKLSFAAVADRLNPRHLIFFSVAGFALGMGCLIRADAGYGMIAVGVGLIGLFGGVMVPLQGFLVPRIFGQRVVGRVSGLLSLVLLCALLATPPLFGLIFDLTGDYDAIFIAFVGLSAATLLLVPYIRLHPRVMPDADAADRAAAASAAAEQSLATP